jgi:hypothetical protein
MQSFNFKIEYDYKDPSSEEFGNKNLSLLFQLIKLQALLNRGLYEPQCSLF